MLDRPSHKKTIKRWAPGKRFLHAKIEDSKTIRGIKSGFNLGVQAADVAHCSVKSSATGYSNFSSSRTRSRISRLLVSSISPAIINSSRIW